MYAKTPPKKLGLEILTLVKTETLQPTFVLTFTEDLTIQRQTHDEGFENKRKAKLKIESNWRPKKNNNRRLE